MPAPSPSFGETDSACGAALAQRRARGRVQTPLRRAVLGLLRAMERPIGAYALLEQLRTTHPQAAPPTVYRALAFLVEQGLVHRIARLNAFIAAGDLRAGADAEPMAGRNQFLICDRCGHTAQLRDPGVVKAFAHVMDRFGFAAHDATIELQGICAACSAADTRDANPAPEAGSRP